jgi:hypothetical protein
VGSWDQVSSAERKRDEVAETWRGVRREREDVRRGFAWEIMQP